MTGVRVPTGYGIVTLYALGKLGLLPEETSMIATIADAAVLKFCGLTEPVIHPTMAGVARILGYRPREIPAVRRENHREDQAPARLRRL